jgi:glycosyltransferase involved in cell wall biosynthesis
LFDVGTALFLLTMKRKKILWLVSWYPNKTDPFDGDFIQRHARAAALYNDIHVLFIKQSETQEEVEKEWKGSDNLSEQIIYLPKRKGLFGKWQNHKQWNKFYKAQVDLLVQKYHPELIHVHVPWKAGLIALWAKKKYKIPFLVTEHWGIYNDIVNDNIRTRSFLFVRYLKNIYRQAASFLSVSKFLGEGVNKLVIERPFQLIPNVVDTDLFFLRETNNSKFRFIHVSNMVSLKNIEGLLEASKILAEINRNFELLMIGNKNDFYKRCAEKLGLNEVASFTGEISYGSVAREMQRSNAFILFSNIENAPCVISEALCCGLPVIATNVGGIPELINNENGVLVEPLNLKALAETMALMIENYRQYDRTRISQQAIEKFNFSAVGKMFDDVYSSLVK